MPNILSHSDSQFCLNQDPKKRYPPFHHVPVYDLKLYNSSIEVTTKLKFPCNCASVRTAFETAEHLKIFDDSLLPSRALLDELYHELLIRACPVIWNFVDDGPWRMFGSLFTGGAKVGSDRHRLVDPSASALSLALRVLNLSSNGKWIYDSKATLFWLRFYAAVFVQPNSLPKVERFRYIVVHMYAYHFRRDKISFNSLNLRRSQRVRLFGFLCHSVHS